MASDYSKYSIPQLWASLQDEDTNEVWRTVSAWQQTADTIDVHLSVLRQARDELIAAWPPEGSGASASFVNFVDELISSMDTTADRAAKNYTALSHIMNGIAVAKREMRPIYKAWKQTGADGDAWQYAPVDSSAKTALRELVTKASAVMRAADARITEAAAGMRPPPRYEPTYAQVKTEGMADNPDKAGAGAGGASIGAGYSAAYIRQPDIPPPGQVDSSATLTGGATTLPAASSLPSSSLSPAGSAGGLPSRSVGQLPVIGTVAAVGSAGAAGASNRSGPTTGARQVVSRGGTIGGQPVTSTTRGTSGSGAQRLMPPGGVIGGSQAGQTAGRGMAPPIGSGGRAEGDEERSRFDPDSPWHVEEGVPPVLEAVPEPTEHHPGPGVIGIDR